MKKLMFLALIAMVLTVFNACQEDENIGISKTSTLDDELSDIGFSIDDNCLVLESEEEFQKLIDFLAKKGDNYFPEFEKVIGFDSYRSTYNGKPKSELFEDKLYSTILNPEMEIIVDNYKFREDPINKKIMVFELGDCNNYKKDKSIPDYIFESEDDIFERLRGEPSLKGTYCDGEKRGYYSWDTSAGKVEYKIVYQTGLYKSLQAKIKKDHWQGPEFISLETDWTETTYYENKSGCWSYSGDDGGYGDEYNLRPYYSTKRLKSYRYKIYFYCSDFGVSPEIINNATLKISCHEKTGCN